MKNHNTRCLFTKRQLSKISGKVRCSYKGTDVEIKLGRCQESCKNNRKRD